MHCWTFSVNVDIVLLAYACLLVFLHPSLHGGPPILPSDLFFFFCQNLCPVLLQLQSHGGKNLYTVRPHGLLSCFITNEIPGILCVFQLQAGPSVTPLNERTLMVFLSGVSGSKCCCVLKREVILIMYLQR